MSDEPIFIFLATYDTEADAKLDYDAVKELHSAGVVGADDAGGVELLDGVVVELRVGFAIVGREVQKDGFVGHMSLLCLPGRALFAGPAWWVPLAYGPTGQGRKRGPPAPLRRPFDRFPSPDVIPRGSRHSAG